MKKLYTFSLLLATAITFAQAADPFMGTGSLNANGWTTHSGATPGQQTIVPGSLTYGTMTVAGNKTQIIAGNTEDVNLASAADITGVAYYSALINVLNTTGLAVTTDPSFGSYFLTCGATTGATVTGFNGRIYIKAGVAADTFNLGVLNGAGGTATPTFSPVDYPINTVTFVVVKFDFATNTASLWVNPALDGAETAAVVTNATGTTAAPAQIRSFVIRQAGSATAGTGNVEIDNVRLGGSWSFVTSSTLATSTFATISGLNVYPSPVTNGVLFVETTANATKEIKVFDVIGKEVLSTTTTGNSVNVSNLNHGIYIVQITEEGKTEARKFSIR